MVVQPAMPVDLTNNTIECWVRNISSSPSELIRLNTKNSVFTIDLHPSSAVNARLINKSVLIDLPMHAWTHLALVVEKNRINVFINGQFSTELYPGIDLSKIISMELGGSGNKVFQGSVDELRIWSVQRTPEQISINRDAVLAGNEAGLEMQYSFDMVLAGNIIPDRTGNGNDGKLLSYNSDDRLSGLMERPLINLPVNPNYFAVGKDLNVVKLFWNTIMEFNTREYVVEKSENGKDFVGIARIAAETRQIAQRRYGFVDIIPANGVAYYRLKIINNDQGYAYSEIRVIH